jgi:hypothetical protein
MRKPGKPGTAVDLKGPVYRAFFCSRPNPPDSLSYWTGKLLSDKLTKANLLRNIS